MADQGNGNGKPQRVVQLQDLVSHATIRKLEPVMNDIAEGKLEISEGKKKIFEILKPEEAELLKKGVIPDYLAWMLAGRAAQSGGHLGSINVK